MLVGKRTVLAKTCPRCGCFKQGHEFGRVGKVYLHTYCKRCMMQHKNKTNTERNDETRSFADKHRQPWGEEELEKLVELLEAGYTYHTVALNLGRTESACRDTVARRNLNLTV